MKLQCLKPRVAALPLRISPLPPISRTVGYRITGTTLQNIRARHFAAHPLCVMCLEQGAVSVAVELDHIVALSKGGADVECNRQGLCRACHAAKTLADMKCR